MKQQNFLEYLQNLHPSHKSKILVVAGIISVIGFGSAWISSVKQQLNGLDTGLASLAEQTGAVLSATNYITIESTEVKNEKRYIYFKVQNNTEDILNFSDQEEVKISLDGKDIPLSSITDRQSSEFPAKILSRSTVYGNVIIDDTEGEEGNIIFENMYFETSPENIFRETIELDLTKLKQIEELRS